MVLDNYVKLEQGIPKRLHFVNHSIGDRLVEDPVLGFAKMISVLTLVVDEEDGVAVTKTLSVTAQSLAAQISGYLPDGIYKGYDFIITRRGLGFATRYTVMVFPRPS